MEKGRITLMNSGWFGLNAIDNFQFPTPRKYQHNGISLAMNMFTSRYFFNVKFAAKELLVLRSIVETARRRKMDDGDIYNEHEDGVEDEETKLEMAKLKRRHVN